MDEASDFLFVVSTTFLFCLLASPVDSLAVTGPNSLADEAGLDSLAVAGSDSLAAGAESDSSGQQQNNERSISFVWVLKEIERKNKM